MCVELPVVLYHLTPTWRLMKPLTHPVNLYCIRSVKIARTHIHRAGFLCQPSMNSSCEAQETSAKGSVLRADVKGGKLCDKAGNLQLKATTCTKHFHT